MSLWESGEIITKDKLNLKTVYIGSSPPTNPVDGMVWVDTSSTPYLIKVYRNGSWDSARGAPTDRVTAPPAEASDYQTPSSASASSQLNGSLSQPYYSYGWSLYGSGTNRAGEKVLANNIGGKIVRRVVFAVTKYVSPTGTAYARVRRADTDQVVYELGSFDVSSFQGDFIAFEGEWSMPSGVDLRFLIEYSGGDENNNIRLLYSDYNVAFGVFSTYVTSWTDYSQYDAYIQIDFAGAANDAKDDNTNTWWSPNPPNEANAWLRFDLGSTLTGVAGCRIYWHSDANYRPQAYKIQASADGSNWDDVYVATTQPPAGWVEYSWQPRNQTRYIRILITQPSTSGTRICEFDYYQSSIWRHGHRGD